MPTTTRQKILDYLKRNKSVSSREIARALQMTPANARHHLSILAADGRVEVIHQRQVGKGRPEKVYQLGDKFLGDNLSVLADALLVEADGKIEMEALGKRIAGEVDSTEQPLMGRLSSAIKRLNEMHYQARWEAGAGGPRIVLGHCPYRSVIENHPELCVMDAALLAKLLGGEVSQTTKLETGAGGLPYCSFVFEQT
ncbi:MAG: helix-turn-helix domain-containing protein [Anaerolineales bacterium]|jgi:predicted ArsR family transcriptional regulator